MHTETDTTYQTRIFFGRNSSLRKLFVQVYMPLWNLHVASFYNIACMIAPYKSYWAALNKILIYTRLCVNKDVFMMTCSAVLSSRFLSTKCPKINGNDEKLSSVFGI